MRTFEEVWLDIKRLEGTDINTLCMHNKNHIKKVTDKVLVRYADKGKGSCTPVERSAFERVWRDLTEKGYCKISDRWKIACACIARLPEVEYSVNSRTIWLTENKHDFGKLVEKT
jgi:hypothetical protein